MVIEWLAGNRIRGTSTDRTVGTPAVPTGTADTAGGVGGWKEVGRTTLGSASDTITVSSLPDKRYYMVLSNIISTGYTYHQIRLNGDSGSNYASRRANNGAADQLIVDQAGIFIAPTTMADQVLSVAYLASKSGQYKLGMDTLVNGGGTGTSESTKRVEMVGKYVPSDLTDPISSLTMYNTHSGDYASGSEIVVLAWDPADTHTTNFWEELASVELSATASQLDSGTFTAKKYLLGKIYAKGTTGINPNLQFNGDTTTNYSSRYSSDGATDGTSTGRSDLINNSNAGNENSFINFNIINNSATEKLMISHETNNNTNGIGNVPSRNEATGKWITTGSQITQITTKSAGTYAVGSIIKVWGSD